MHIHALRRLLTRALPALAAALVAAAPAHATDFGVIGPVHEIRERHGIELILEKLQKKKESGEIARWEEDTKKRAIESVRNPKPVAGLGPTQRARTYYFDPTGTVQQNIVDHRGNILFPAGYKKNPLEVFSLSKHLLFFDARDPDQVKFANTLITHYQGRVKPILVGGSYLDLMRQWKRQVYYDQLGVLTTKFGIKNVPALVSQEGLRLRIDELRVKG